MEKYIELITKEDDIKIKTKSEREGEFNYFQKYCKDMIKSNGRVTKTYSQKDGRGRFYCPESIQMRPSAVRGFLLDEIGTDIDMVNCHPTILLYICKQNQVICPNLEYYVNNRSAMIKDSPSLKHDIIQFINASNAIPTDEFLVNFKKECKKIHSALFKLDKFADYLKAASEKKNKIGSAMFSVMEDVEVEIMHKVLDFMLKKKIKPAVLMHDGLVVYGDYYSDRGLLGELEALVEGEFTGLGMKFAYKNHCTKIQIPESFEFNDQGEEEEEHLSDRDVGEKLFEQYSKQIIKNNEILYAYYKNSWSEDIDKVFQQWISTCDFNIRCGSKSKPLLVGSQTHKWSHYIKQLTCICIEKLESVDLLNKAKDILPFQNGFYNFKTGAFVEYNDEDIAYFTYKVNRRFPSSVDAEAQREIEHVVTDIFNNDTNLMDEFFSFEARALSNHVEDKVGRCVVGERNSAKGFVMQLNMLAFAGVVGNVISNDLVSKKNSMESAERRNGFLKTFCENLLCISEEVDSKTSLDGTMWKSIASGGDKVKYRTAFGQLSENRIRALYTITCNKPPTFTTADASENMILCNMPCKYMEVIPDDGCGRGFVIKQADPDIKTKFVQEKYIDAYTLFVLKFYKATKPKYSIMTEMNLENTEIGDDYVDPKDGLAVCVDKLLIITKSSSDQVKCSEVHKLIISQFRDASPQKIKVYLGNRGVEVKKNVVNYYKGITLKEDTEQPSLFDN